MDFPSCQWKDLWCSRKGENFKITLQKWKDFWICCQDLKWISTIHKATKHNWKMKIVDRPPTLCSQEQNETPWLSRYEDLYLPSLPCLEHAGTTFWGRQIPGFPTPAPTSTAAPPPRQIDKYLFENCTSVKATRKNLGRNQSVPLHSVS